MCSCEFNFTCWRHREPTPEAPDGDDPYNDEPADPHVSEYEVRDV
jgi:hypothetical protein